MKLALTLTLFSALLLAASAEARGRRQQPADAGRQTPATAPSQAGSPELAEAARLSAEVVRLHKERKFSDAQPLAERALALREKALGGDHLLVGSALLNLAAVQSAREKHRQSEESYRRAVVIFEKAGAERQLAEARRQLGAQLLARGEYAEALPLLESVVAVDEKATGERREVLAYSLSLLTQLHLAQGETGKAAQAWHRALTIWRELYGKEDPRVQNFEDAMACLLARRLNHEQSVAFNGRLGELAAEAKGAALSGGIILNGKVLRKPQPDYPEAARAARVSGTVVVRVKVDEAGKVVEARAICGPQQLTASSEEAARRATFSPTLRDGQPVKVSGVITYNYVLR